MDVSSAPSADGWDAQVERRIETLVARAGEASGAVGPALREYLAGGKRLRARLVLAAGCAGRRVDGERLARYGAFVELIHAGGLCHDDIVDRSPRRRSGPSLAFSHGRRMASVAGVHLMLRAYLLVATASPRVRAAVAGAAERVASGQADEMMDLYRLDLAPSDYVARARAKTATLFELAADLGAEAGGVDRAVRADLVAFGTALGTAYQLADDLRDLTGDAVVGRLPGTDLREGVYPLPVLMTMHGGRDGAAALPGLLARLRRARDPLPFVEEVRALLTANGSIAASRTLLQSIVRDARSRVRGFPAEPRRRLERLVEIAIPATGWRPVGGP